MANHGRYVSAQTADVRDPPEQDHEDVAMMDISGGYAGFMDILSGGREVLKGGASFHLCLTFLLFCEEFYSRVVRLLFLFGLLVVSRSLFCSG